jgi:hypothetical protein
MLTLLLLLLVTRDPCLPAMLLLTQGPCLLLLLLADRHLQR